MARLQASPLGVGSFRLGESPIVLGRKVVFVDLEGRALHRLDLDSGRLDSTAYAQRVCAVVPAAAGALLVALESRLELMDGTGSRTVVSTDVPAGVRLNDGACDSHGRFFVGMMGYERESGLGSLRCLHGGRLVPVLTGLTLPNGLGWSPDGGSFYLVDSMERTVSRYGYDSAAGEIGPQRDVLDLSHLSGYPDGMTVDADGNLWVAFWSGGAVRCLTPTGTVRHEVSVAAPDATSCTFLGPGELLITTALGDGIGPHAGDLFLAQVAAAGCPDNVWQAA